MLQYIEKVTEPRSDGSRVESKLRLSLNGGHVESFSSKLLSKDNSILCQREHLFFKEKQFPEECHSGIPLCFPQWASSADNRPLEHHGFVKSLEWRIVEKWDGGIRIQTELANHKCIDLDNRCHGKHMTLCQATYEFNLDGSLDMSFKATSLEHDDVRQGHAMQCTFAWHPYWATKDLISYTTIKGVEGALYKDKTLRLPVTHGIDSRPEIKFDGAEVDIVYPGFFKENEFVEVNFMDEGRLTIRNKNNINDLVIWNVGYMRCERESTRESWTDKGIGKFGWESYVCVEPVNDEVQMLDGNGESFTCSVNIRFDFPSHS